MSVVLPRPQTVLDNIIGGPYEINLWSYIKNGPNGGKSEHNYDIEYVISIKGIVKLLL